MVRLLSLKKLLLVYFVMSTGALLWFILNFGLFCHTSSKEEETLLTKTKELRQWEERLRRRERDLQKKSQEDASLPTIYAIMPTHTRHVQKAELTRLAQTFLHIKNFHWILVEDSDSRTDLVTRFLASCGIKYTHLNIKTPEDYQLKETDPNWLKPRGVEQRNVGLQWLREHLDVDRDKGVVYFADDDNTYSLQLFEEVVLCMIDGFKQGLKSELLVQCLGVISHSMLKSKQLPVPLYAQELVAGDMPTDLYSYKEKKPASRDMLIDL